MILDWLPVDVRFRLEETCLFYPASGRDVAEPVAVFAPLIRTFVFADTGYFGRSDRPTTPALNTSPGFEFLSAESLEVPLQETDWKYDRKYEGVPPRVETEQYRHVTSGVEISVERHRRRAPSTLRSLQRPLGVFFYRGDSQEGGSRTLWLTVTRRGANVLFEVLERLVDGGLIATDGSNCLRRFGGRENPYRFFTDAVEQARSSSRPVEEWRSVHYVDGRQFRLLGCISNRRDRPTLLWAVTQGA